jgi:flagellar hook-basal body complex protein FliE
MPKDLEQVNPPTEQVTPTPEGEQVASTEPKEEPTVRIEETPEFKKALGKSLSSINTRLSESKKATETAKVEAEQHKAENESNKAHIEALIKETEEALADDPERKQTYVNRIANLKDKQAVAIEKAEAIRIRTQGEAMIVATAFKEKSVSLLKEVKEAGFDITELVKELEDCETEEEMELKALRFQVKMAGEVKPEKEEEDPKFHSGKGDRAGTDLRKLTAQQLIERGLKK